MKCILRKYFIVCRKGKCQYVQYVLYMILRLSEFSTVSYLILLPVYIQYE